MGILLVEPAIITDIYVSGMADPDDLGNGDVRLTFYTRQKSFADYANATECVVVARLVMPFSAVLQAHRLAGSRLGLACCGVERLRLAH
jgi:hypothetical protein